MVKRLIVLLIAFLISGAPLALCEDLNINRRDGDSTSNLNEDAFSNSNLDLYYLELSQDSGRGTLSDGYENEDWAGFKPGDKSRESTVFWGGIFPFIAIPDAQDNGDNPGFLSKDSVSFFWYFKKKF
ncbi:MAG TPA: hypothetical protein VNN20_12375 [Thermodesulfobacteriota bacterium]|nr:hypothetical protein [Thermodesulfobacteriota bacterium]